MPKCNFSYLPPGRQMYRWLKASRDSVSRVSSPVENLEGVGGEPGVGHEPGVDPEVKDGLVVVVEF